MRTLLLLCLVALVAGSRKKAFEFTDPNGIPECDFSVTLQVPDPAPFEDLVVGEDVTLRFVRDGGRYTTLISSEMRRNWLHQWWIGPQFNPVDHQVYGLITCTYETGTVTPTPIDCQDILEAFFPTREVTKTVDGVHYRAFVGSEDGDEVAKVSCYSKMVL